MTFYKLRFYAFLDFLYRLTANNSKKHESFLRS